MTNYTWSGSSSAAWNDATNWIPEGVPTFSDDVSVQSSGAPLNVNISSGAFFCASLDLVGPVNFSFGSNASLSVSGDGSLSGDFIIAGQGLLQIDGQLVATSGSLQAQNGGAIEIAHLEASQAPVAVSVDGTSSIEIGNGGAAAAGSILVDANFSATMNGSLSAAQIIDNGTISLSAGGSLLLNGALGGSGRVDVGNGATLTVQTVDVASSNRIDFTGNGGVLVLSSTSLNSSGVFQPTIYGLNSSDVIDFQGALTSTQYDPVTGILQLLNGASVTATINIGGSYQGAAFAVLPATGSQSLVELVSGGDTATAPEGTETPDDYVWKTQGGWSVGYGSWDSAANWTDNTQAGAASVPPGINDAVTINHGRIATFGGGSSSSSGGGLPIKIVILPVEITGVGASASLTINGPTILDGQFSTGTLTLESYRLFHDDPDLQLAENIAGCDLGLFDGASLTVTGSAQFIGAVGVRLDGGGVLSILGNATSDSHLFIQSGLFSVSGNLSAAQLDLSDGQLSVGQSSSVGDLTASGSSEIDGVVNATSLQMSGSLTIGSASSLNVSTAAGFQPSSTVDLGQGGVIAIAIGTSEAGPVATVNGGLTVAGSGSFLVGGLTAIDGSISATDQARLQLKSIEGNAGPISLLVGGNSSIEIGGEGFAQGGSLTIDADAAANIYGTISAPTLVVDGLLSVTDHQTLTIQGPSIISGHGQIDIGSSSTLSENALASSSGLTINFLGQGATLSIGASAVPSSGLFAPTITNFGITDAIDFQGTVTSALYANGALSLYNGSSLVGTLSLSLSLSGSYAGYSFSALSINQGYATQINLEGPTSVAPDGTVQANNYIWTGPVAGNWADVQNWKDISTPSTSAAPGAADNVEIGVAAGGAAHVITGDGNAAALTINGETLLHGQFNALSLAVATTGTLLALQAGDGLTVAGDASFASYTGTLIQGGTLTVGGTFNAGARSPASSFAVDAGANGTGGHIVVEGDLVANYSDFEITGTSGVAANLQSSLAIAGNFDPTGGGSSFNISNAIFTVGGTFHSLNDTIAALQNSVVQLGALQEQSGSSGAALSADAGSSIEIGKASTAPGAAQPAQGAITIDQGVTTTEFGSFNAPQVIVDGTLIVADHKNLSVGGALALNNMVQIGEGAAVTVSGALSGSGAIEIGNNASLSIFAQGAATSTGGTIDFSGSGGTLFIGDTNPYLTEVFAPTITNFGVTDTIDFQGAVTSAQYANGALSLYNGSNLVATLSLTGNYAGYTFSALSIIQGQETQINLEGPTSAAPDGTGQANDYIWTGPVVGNWADAQNWQDNAQVAIVAPGASDSVTIGVASGGAAHVVTGDGNAAALTINGETLLHGQFNASSLAVATTGTLLALQAGDGLTVAGDASFASSTGTLIQGGTLTVDGTFNAGMRSSSTWFTTGVGADGTGGHIVVGGDLVGNYSDFEITGAFGLPKNLQSSLTVAGNVFDPVTGSSSYILNNAIYTVGGTFYSLNNTISAQQSSFVQLGALQEEAGSYGVTISTDASSSVEIGKASNAPGAAQPAQGAITIDQGVSVTEFGSFNTPQVIVDGTLIVADHKSLYIGGALTLNDMVQIGEGSSLTVSGGLSGGGTIEIGDNASLSVSAQGAAATTGGTIDFNGSGGTLWIGDSDPSSTEAFAPTITDFGATDTIDFQGTVTSAQYANGALNLYNGSSLVATLSLTGSYAGYEFSALSINQGNATQINLEGPTSAAPVGTGHADNFVWTGSVAGSWAGVQNWQDISTPSTSAAPGASDNVEIGVAAGGAAHVITGDGNAATLSINGETLLHGQFNASSLAVATTGTLLALQAGDGLTVAGDASFASSTGTLIQGGTLTVDGTFNAGMRSPSSWFSAGVGADGSGGHLVVGGDLVGNYSDFEITGTSGLSKNLQSSLTVAGNVLDLTGSSFYDLDNAIFTVGGTFYSLNSTISALQSSVVQLGALQEEAGSYGVALDTDGSSSIEIGKASNAPGAAQPAQGAITIDQGVTTTEFGSFNAPQVIVDGTLIVADHKNLSIGGGLTLNNTVQIGEGASLAVSGALSGSSAIEIGDNASLSVFAPGAAISTGGIIDFQGSGGTLRIGDTNPNVTEGFAPTITNFGVTDTIDFQGTVTSAHYANGALNLYNGSSLVATLALTGNYAGYAFSALSIDQGYTTQLNLEESIRVAPAGTVQTDNYVWTGPVAGNWADAQNWQDNAQGAIVAPGASDNVAIGVAPGGAAHVITGDGNAAALTLNGETLLHGQFNASSLAVATTGTLLALQAGDGLTVAGDANFAYATGTLIQGGTLTVGGTFNAGMRSPSAWFTTGVGADGTGGHIVINGDLVGNYSDFEIAGASGLAASLQSSLAVAGNVLDTAAGSSIYSINNAIFTVGGTFYSLSDTVAAQNNSFIQLGALQEGTSSSPAFEGVTLSADASSSIEIGKASNAPGAAQPVQGAITIDQGVTVTEFGNFSAPQVIVNGTLVVADDQSLSIGDALTLNNAVQIGDGALLTVSGALSGSGAIEIGDNATLSVLAQGVAASTGGTIDFSGSSGTLRMNFYSPQPFQGFAPKISNFGATDKIDLTNVAYDSAGHADLVAGNKLEITEGGSTYEFKLDPLEDFSNLYFHLAQDSGSGTFVTESAVACYCRGTLILTNNGEVAVEALRIGDQVATRSGQLRPIKWIGRRAYGGRFLLGQKRILPVRIGTGALGENVPRRDLWISPHHAMYLEGVLIEARDLVNGINVVQPDDTQAVEYFHIELETHDVIVAEGAFSETFVDDDSRGMFHNVHEYNLLYPNETTIHAYYCAPRCADGFAVDAARRKIAQRARQKGAMGLTQAGRLRGYVDLISPVRIEGWAQDERHPEAPVCLDIVLDGKCVDRVLASRYREDLLRAGLGSGNHGFSYVMKHGPLSATSAVEVRRSIDGLAVPTRSIVPAGAAAPSPPMVRCYDGVEDVRAS